MPVFSDEVNIFEAYCKDKNTSKHNKIIKTIEQLLNEIQDETLKDKILKEILNLKIILNK